MFITTFVAAFLAVCRIALIAGAGFFLVKKRILTQQDIRAISRGVVYFFLPCLIFAKMTQGFDPAMESWWKFPLSAVVVFGAGLGTMLLVFRGVPRIKELIPLSVLQNAGYLVLPIGQSLFPDRYDAFAIYTFLFIMVQSPLLWSVGPYCIASKKQGSGWTRVFNPPFVTILVSLVLVFTGWNDFIPNVIGRTATLAGDAAVPISIFILGGGLGILQWTRPANLGGLCLAALNKLVLVAVVFMPLAGLAGLYGTSKVFESMLLLQCCMPPAVGLMIQAKNYDGNQQLVSAGLLISYLCSLLTVPLVISVWEAVRLFFVPGG